MLLVQVSNVIEVVWVVFACSHVDASQHMPLYKDHHQLHFFPQEALTISERVAH